jgi:predicted transcriptional regulator
VNTAPAPDDERLARLKELPPLMPLFLRKRRAGLGAVREMMGMLGVEPREFFTLMLLYTITGSYGAPPTPAQMRLWSRYVYSSRDLLTEPLEILDSKGLILQDMEGGYTLTPWARGAVESVHEAAWAHLSRMDPLPPDRLQRLAEVLERASLAVREDPALGDRPGTHLAGSRALAWFPQGSHPMVRIEGAIYDLWLARDDAHIAAWRDAGLEGPQVQALTLLWSGETSSAAALTELLKEDATPEDVETTLALLMEKGYVTRDEDALSLTPEGALTREDIERETDRRYFAHWPHTAEEAEWLRANLAELVGNIPMPPPTQKE